MGSFHYHCNQVPLASESFPPRSHLSCGDSLNSPQKQPLQGSSFLVNTAINSANPISKTNAGAVPSTNRGSSRVTL